MIRSRVFAAFLIVAIVGSGLMAFAQPKIESPTRIYLKTTEPRSAAVMRHQGPLTEMPAVIAKMTKEIDTAGYSMTGPVMCVYHNSPQEVPPSELLWEIRIPVAYPGKLDVPKNDEMTFGYMHAMYVAYIYHIGPYEKIGDAYRMLYEWGDRQKYELKGKPIELYWNDPASTPPEKLVTEIWLPIGEKKVRTGLK